MSTPATKIVLVFEKAADSASMHSILVESPGVEVHAVFNDKAKPKQLLTVVNRKEVAQLLGQRLVAAEALLSTLSSKLTASDTVTFTKEEVTALLMSAGESPNDAKIDNLVMDLAAPGPFTEGVDYAALEEAAQGEASSLAKIDPTSGLDEQEDVGRPILNIARTG